MTGEEKYYYGDKMIDGIEENYFEVTKFKGEFGVGIKTAEGDEYFCHTKDGIFYKNTMV